MLTNKAGRRHVHTLSLLAPLVQIIWCLDFVQKNKNNQSEDTGKVVDVT